MKLLSWLKENGCIWDKLQWPAVFGDGLVGCRAIDDIQPLEAFMYVPTPIQMSVEHARASEIGGIFQNHDFLFVASAYRDNLILTVWLIYEKLKGDASFWEPYISHLADVGIPAAYWDQEILGRSDY